MKQFYDILYYFIKKSNPDTYIRFDIILKKRSIARLMPLWRDCYHSRNNSLVANEKQIRH